MTFRFSPAILIGCTAISLATAYSTNAFAQVTGGQELYERHCSACHSMLPPPKSAPPVAGLSYFYHKAFADREQGVRHIMEFVAKPAVEKSKLRPPAISRFGLMPAVELDARDLRTVSEWLWDSYDPKFQPPDCPAK
ncbi:MAG TPA: cytochrome C [Chlorobaculum sp.]|uniref:Cytochrome c, putative n=1 Tax=Chlorobaculum tepidum (strain ATCC 49652 / DSM 12025 / NBRC 103806 / TLS) TaxID=194439 RepID=Q8KBQ1_CHLTE|nr:c-type cytochrome [Chlorobaculum tepidum]AAM72956.1 cytochrome c, putative [Chlorobaculum tepidum TLS]HBU24403.1 cytochrome C [Chlorobaculum sp.]